MKNDFTKYYNGILGAFILLLLFPSCSSQQGAAIGNTTLSSVQQMLTEASNRGFDVLGNAQAFATNTLVDAALPKEMRDINAKL